MLLINLTVTGCLLVTLYQVWVVYRIQKRLKDAELALLEVIFEMDPTLKEKHPQLAEWIKNGGDVDEH